MRDAYDASRGELATGRPSRSELEARWIARFIIDPSPFIIICFPWRGRVGKNRFRGFFESIGGTEERNGASHASHVTLSSLKDLILGYARASLPLRIANSASKGVSSQAR